MTLDSIRIDKRKIIERVLSMEIVRATERAAVSAASFSGRADETSAVHAAANAMHEELHRLPIDGRIVASGEGERTGKKTLFSLGDRISGDFAEDEHGFTVDIAVDPLEGRSLCAHNLPGAVTALAIAEKGSLQDAPDIYMNKIAIGPQYPKDIVDLSAPPAENIRELAKAKQVDASEITAIILDRERHQQLIESVRATGARVRLIRDGDIVGALQTIDPDSTGVDIYMGHGGAPEGILAAAALRCAGGQFQGQFLRPTKIRRDLADVQVDFGKIYNLDELIRGDCLFSITGITDGFLRGVRFRTPDAIETETLVMRSFTGTIRWVRTEHHQLRLKKFNLSAQVERWFAIEKRTPSRAD